MGNGSGQLPQRCQLFLLGELDPHRGQIFQLPLDLLRRHPFPASGLDAYEPSTKPKTAKEISTRVPTRIVTSRSPRRNSKPKTWDEDRAFLAQVARAGRRILAIGDVLQENSEDRLREEPWLEACLHAFANDDVLLYLRGQRATTSNR